MCIRDRPPPEKKYWRRYVYLWLNYACFEELDIGDLARARAVYRAALDVVPHDRFTFGKLWLGAAHLEVRAGDLAAARKVLGEALGRCRRLAKPKLYAGYAHLERQLGEVDRCRSIYAKWLEAAPTNCAAWARFARAFKRTTLTRAGGLERWPSPERRGDWRRTARG